MCLFFQWSESEGGGGAVLCPQICARCSQWCLESGQPSLHCWTGPNWWATLLCLRSSLTPELNWTVIPSHSVSPWFHQVCYGVFPITALHTTPIQKKKRWVFIFSLTAYHLLACFLLLSFTALISPNLNLPTENSFLVPPLGLTSWRILGGNQRLNCQNRAHEVQEKCWTEDHLKTREKKNKGLFWVFVKVTALVGIKNWITNPLAVSQWVWYADRTTIKYWMIKSINILKIFLKNQTGLSDSVHWKEWSCPSPDTNTKKVSR